MSKNQQSTDKNMNFAHTLNKKIKNGDRLNLSPSYLTSILNTHLSKGMMQSLYYSMKISLSLMLNTFEQQLRDYTAH